MTVGAGDVSSVCGRSPTRPHGRFRRLRGNGMCFTTELLRKHPPTKPNGLVEDVEYGIAIGLRRGARRPCRLRPKGTARWCRGRQSVGVAAAALESGRHLLLGQDATAKATQRRHPANAARCCSTLAFDLAVPALSYLACCICPRACFSKHLDCLGHRPPWPLARTSSALSLVGLRRTRRAYQWFWAFAAVLALGYGHRSTLFGKLFVALKPGRKNRAWFATRRENEFHKLGVCKYVAQISERF